MNSTESQCPVLIVEDDEDLRDMMAQMLTIEGFAAATVANGREALDYLHRRGSFASRSHENPAVILLDLKLPKVDGIEVLQHVKANDTLKTTPVVVLTSSNEERDMVASYRLGVNAYVVKPVDFHEFVNAVKELGIFWAIINVPPPGSLKKSGRS